VAKTLIVSCMSCTQIGDRGDRRSPLGWDPGGLLNIRLEDGLPFVTVKLGQGTEGLVLERVLLDTGSAATVFAVDEIATLEIVPEPTDRIRRVVGIGGIELVLAKRIESLALGDIQVRDFPVDAGPLRIARYTEPFTRCSSPSSLTRVTQIRSSRTVSSGSGRRATRGVMLSSAA
jgi:hypothetical protein